MQKQLAIPRTRAIKAPFGKMGVLVVDMQYMRRKGTGELVLSYDHGTLDQGIQRMCSLLKVAQELGLPIIAVKYNLIPANTPDMIEEIREIIENYKYGRIFMKSVMCAFDNNPEFVEHMEELNLDSLIVGGFNRTACVRANIIAALLYRLKVIISEQILFGHRYADLKNPERIIATMNFYKRHTHLFDDLASILEIMRMNRLQPES